MPRLMVFNDPHHTRYAPECRADTYPQEILAKLHGVARMAKKLKCMGILCTGDWMHRKGRCTFREANDLLAVLTRWVEEGFLVAGILGNHDIAGHSLDSLDTRAVGSLVHSGALHLLDRNPLVAGDDEGDVYVTGTSYFHGCDASDEGRVKAYGAAGPETPGQVHIHLAHGTLLQGGSFFEDYTVAPDLIELLCERGVCPDVIVCGHLHFSEGVKLYKRPGTKRKVAVCRVGSLGRVSADDMERQPHALVIAVKNGQFKCQPVPVRAAKLIRTTEPQTKKPDHTERIQEFVKHLRVQAEAWSLADWRKLLETIEEDMRLELEDDSQDELWKEALSVAIHAVEQRQ